MGVIRQLLWWGQLAGCYVFVFFSPFWTSAAEAGFALAVTCWVFDWLFEFPRPFPAAFLVFPTLIFLLACFIAAIFGFSFSRSLVFLSKQWVILGLFFFALRFKEESIRQRALLWLGISSGLAALYAILQGFTGWHIGLAQPLETLGYGYRVTGFFSVLLSFGFYFSLTALAFLAAGWPKRNITSGKIYLAVSGLSYLAVLLNAGRAGLLSVLAGFAVWLLLSTDRRKWQLLPAVTVLTLLAWGANPAIFSRFEQFKGYEFQPAAENRRLAVWQRSYEIFQNHPVFGIGPDNFKTVYAEKIKGTWAKPLGHAHNDFLNVLAYAGLFGLAAFVFFWKTLAFSLWEAFRSNRGHPALLTGLLVLTAYFVYAQFESSLIYREIRMILFFLLGAGLAAEEVRTA